MISFRPLMNSDRFLQRDSTVYPRATFAGSRVFQPSSARRTFSIALSRVNGGNGGREGVVSAAMMFSPRTDSFGVSIASLLPIQSCSVDRASQASRMVVLICAPSGTDLRAPQFRLPWYQERSVLRREHEPQPLVHPGDRLPAPRVRTRG